MTDYGELLGALVAILLIWQGLRFDSEPPSESPDMKIVALQAVEDLFDILVDRPHEFPQETLLLLREKLGFRLADEIGFTLEAISESVAFLSHWFIGQELVTVPSLLANRFHPYVYRLEYGMVVQESELMRRINNPNQSEGDIIEAFETFFSKSLEACVTISSSVGVFEEEANWAVLVTANLLADVSCQDLKARIRTGFRKFEFEVKKLEMKSRFLLKRKRVITELVEMRGVDFDLKETGDKGFDSCLKDHYHRVRRRKELLGFANVER
jgi:hypothetical protein